MADKLVTLQDENKVPIYPETRASVVKTTEGTTVEDALAGKQPIGDYALRSEIPENYTLPKAESETLGGIKIGYTENEKNYPVELDPDGAAFVNVPWTDNDTTYEVVGANGTIGLVKNGSSETSSSGCTACPIIEGIPYFKDSYTGTEKKKVDDSLRLNEYADVEDLGLLPSTPYNLRFVYSDTTPKAISFSNVEEVPEMQEFYLSIKNNTDSTISQPIPNGYGWQTDNMSVDIEAGKIVGISLKKEHGVIVVRI